MKIEFDTKPDVIGMGRVIVDGKYYGLPVSAVIHLKELTDMNNLGWQGTECPMCGAVVTKGKWDEEKQRFVEDKS